MWISIEIHNSITMTIRAYVLFFIFWMCMWSVSLGKCNFSLSCARQNGYNCNCYSLVTHCRKCIILWCKIWFVFAIAKKWNKCIHSGQMIGVEHLHQKRWIQIVWSIHKIVAHECVKMIWIVSHFGSKKTVEVMFLFGISTVHSHTIWIFC